jgi:hypothetical protein
LFKVAGFARAVLALSQDALAEGLDEELSQALLDEIACLREQVSILQAHLPPINSTSLPPMPCVCHR